MKRLSTIQSWWRSQRLGRVMGGIVLIGLLASGCGKNESSDSTELWQGEVDRQLSPEMQAKQDALIELFAAIQENDDFRFLSRMVPHVRFQETHEDFLEGMLELTRWRFDGSPQGDELRVIIQLRENKPPDYPVHERKRVYQVRKVGNHFVVQRVSGSGG